MNPRSHTWRVNGLDHHVLEWGRSDGPTAIIVHGFQNAAASWDDVAEGLATDGLRVLAPDMRGFGDGARVPPGGYYYFPDYVSDLAGIARAHASDVPLYVIGHSMGATVASYFAGAFPERVTKLALIDGLGPPDNGPDIAPARMRRWIETAYDAPPGDRKPMTRAEALGRMARFNPDLDEAILARRLAQLSREVDGGLVWKADPLHATTSPIPFLAESYKAFARLVTCPVLYVSGGEKGFHVEDEDERLACFQKLEKVTIDGGHALHWTRPAELVERLVTFWRR
jgi:pimeloyl-ACP methyl ester carboxylesterase